MYIFKNVEKRNQAGQKAIAASWQLVSKSKSPMGREFTTRNKEVKMKCSNLKYTFVVRRGRETFVKYKSKT